MQPQQYLETEDEEVKQDSKIECGYVVIGGLCQSSILKQGRVKKRSKIFFTKKRMLYFTSDLKLIFIKLNTDTLDEELYLDQSVTV